MEKVYHELSPIYNKESRVLILGSLPSTCSREAKFYYAHKRNRFWPIMEDIFETNLPTKEEKIDFLLTHHIALWDVVASCQIEGSSDQSIRNVVCNDISGLLLKSNIHTIFSTGRKSYELYQKYIYPQTGVESIYLPSTSPANLSISYATLKENYIKIKEAVKDTI